MAQKLSNNARATLTANILAADTSLTVGAGSADLFPVADTGAVAIGPGADWFKVTLEKSTGENEIVYVRTRAAGVAIMSNVIRAQEGTTALNFSTGDVVELRITALDIQNAVAQTEGAAAAAAIAAHLADASDAHDASAISVADAGNFFAGADVEAVLQELGRLQATVSVAFSATPTFDAALALDHLFGNLTANVTAVAISNPVQSREIRIRAKQDGTGGRTWAHPTSPAAAKGVGSMGLLPNQVTEISYKYNLADTRWEYVMTALGV